jgi:hypothetical protein
MSIDPPSGNTLTVRVSGQLTSSEWRSALENVAASLRQSPDISGVLVNADGFLGWGRGDWDEAVLQSQLDMQIKRMAVVGEKKWEIPVLMFVGSGLRRIDIEYFVPSDLEKARRWLTTESDDGPSSRPS